MPGTDKYLKIKDSSGQEKTIRIADYKEIELYERTAPYFPTYTIPALVVDNDTIRMVRFSISKMYNRKKRIIDLLSFAYDSVSGHYPSRLFMRKKLGSPINENWKKY
ncbi:MAG: hypothetical protein WDO16_00175 [Bacteroidota bacterium]